MKQLTHRAKQVLLDAMDKEPELKEWYKSFHRQNQAIEYIEQACQWAINGGNEQAKVRYPFTVGWVIAMANNARYDSYPNGQPEPMRGIDPNETD